MADQVLVCIGLTLWRYVLLPTMSVLPLKPRVSDLGASGGDAGKRARGTRARGRSHVGGRPRDILGGQDQIWNKILYVRVFTRRNDFFCSL